MRVLSTNKIYPVRPVYAWDPSLTLGSCAVPFTADDGFYLFESETMNKTVDIKMNRNTVIQLLSASDIPEVLIDTNINTGIIGNYLIFTSPTDTTSSLEYAIAVDLSGSMRVTNDIAGDKEDICYFTLTKTDVGTQIRRASDSFTSVFGNLDTQYFVDAQDQTFSLVPAGNGWYVLYDYESNPMSLSGSPSDFLYFAFSKDGITATAIDEILLTGLTASNKWVQYENVYKPDYSNEPSILTPEEDRTISGVDLNYLMLSPYYSITIDDETNDAILPYDIIPVKNFKSINSDQMLLPLSGNSPDKINLRQYERIYSGASQLEGYPEIHLGFTSDYGTIITLNPDKYTYFHIPETAEEYVLSGTNLRSIGAVAGSAPAYSDRIYKRLSDYNDNIWWGGDTEQVNNGTWLCAWLSGNSDDSIWMERYYDPGQITQSIAMAVTGYDTSSFVPNSGSVISDLPSQMRLTAGSYFKYFHAGTQTLTDRVDRIFGDNGDGLLFKFSDFVSDAPSIADGSGNGLSGTLSNPTVSNVESLNISIQAEKLPAILFNSNLNEITIDPSSIFDTPTSRTTMGWVYLDDWNNHNNAIQSEAIFSNYFKGGDKLEYINHGLYYSSIIPTPSGGKVAIIPANANSTLLTQIDTELSGMSTVVDLDGNLYICGYSGTDSLIYKFAPDGTHILNVEYPFSKFKQIIIKDDNIGYIQDNDSNTKWQLDLNTLTVGVSSSAPSSGTLYQGMDGEIYSHSYSSFDIFADGVECYITGSQILVDGQLISNPPETLSLSNVYCDDNRYVYVTYIGITNVYSLCRYDRITETWGVQTAGVPYSSPPSSINQAFITKERLNNKVQDILYWVMGTGVIYKYYSDPYDNLTLIGEIDVSGTTSISINASDFSGFKLNKVHNKLNNNLPILKYSVMVNDVNPIKMSITTPISGYTNNWHHIVASKTPSKILLYIDGERTSQLDISGDLVYHQGNVYNIGGGIIAGKTVASALSSNNRINIGISDFMVSNISVSDITVLSKYDLYYATSTPLQWPVKTQPRNFVEQIKSVNKFKVPGRKSQFYNIIVRNMDIPDEQKAEYEMLIRSQASESTPAYLKLKDIIWK